MTPMFLIWIPIAITQIILFSIFLFKCKNSEQVVEETIDIIPIYVYNKMAYWKQKDSLMRAPYRNSSIDVDSGSKVDELNSDLLPSEIMEIIAGLEKA
jgi:hypothetical protein